MPALTSASTSDLAAPSDITVRKMRFEFPGDFSLEGCDDSFAQNMSLLAVSLTMPYLEPYLIRSMKVAIPKITDPVLAEDARRFSQQEGHHYRNHAVFNKNVREHFGGSAADDLRAIENDLENDYRRFTKEKPLRWNLAYAEGFEAMTCSGAIAMAEHGAFTADNGTIPGGELWGWHMAEEIEHREVAFCVFDHLVGSYFYRVIFSARSQYHYLSYIVRFMKCMSAACERPVVPPKTPMQRSAVRRWLGTFSPFYHPSKIVVPPSVDGLLARYSQLAGEGPFSVPGS